MPDNEPAPNIDPVLSSGAMKLRRKKLDNLPWDHSGRHPGNSFFWHLIIQMMNIAWRYIFRSRQVDAPPNYTGGRIFSSIHINGLVDPMSLVLSQDRKVISMGRHDLMTMPLIGWFSRRMGSQPVIRKPEIRLGVADEEYASRINQRTLLTMTNCIAAGHNAVVMPEGKSHQDSRLHRFKTGPMRFGINAAAIADEKGQDTPALQPVGLHYRRHYWFRTDLFVEFREPIPIEPPSDPDHGLKLANGEWTEPPHEQVNTLKDELFRELSIVTPNAPDWPTYRAWHLLAHIDANQSGSSLDTFKDEVFAAREVRNLLSNDDIPEEALELSMEAAEILHSHDLDGRAISDSGVSATSQWGRLLGSLFLMLVAAPLTVVSTGAQAIIAWYLGDRTDEGVDARTTYHMLAAMFSPVLFWPPIAAIVTYYAIGQGPLLAPGILLMIIAFHLSNLTFLLGYDLWADFANSRRRTRLFSSSEGAKLEGLLSETKSILNLSK